MGFFGAYVFDGTRWSEHDPGDEPAVTDVWLWLNIHDSDFTMVAYGPPGPGSGVAYLGTTPRIYFEDPSASEPTDADIESSGLAVWWAGLHPEADQSAMAAKATELRAFIASDNDPIGDEDTDLDDRDDADVFVEIKTGRFVRALGLSLPDGLPE